VAHDKQAAERRLDNLLMTRDRHRRGLEVYRDKGDTPEMERCQRALKLDHSRIRQHCTEHGLDLPNDIPAERF
jgi:hypothetical protein